MKSFTRISHRGVVKTVATGALLLAGNAYAAVPTEVTTSLTDGKADAITVAGAVLAIMIAVSAFIWMRRAAK